MFYLFMFVTNFSYAQESETPLRIRLNVGGMAIAGNFNQIQVNGGGMVNYDKGDSGNDTVINGYRMWTKPPGSDERIRIGDNLNIANIAYSYVKPKLYVQGFGNYSTSQLHQINDRYVGGLSLGFTPIRQKDQLFRCSLGGFWEHTSYPTGDFNLDVSHDGPIRSIPRVGLISNGWYKVPNDNKLSFNYLFWFYINPMELIDYRYRLNADVNFHITKILALKLSTTYEHNSVVVGDISKYDLRSNLGLSIVFPQKK